ncbi:IS5 family transposase, partial [Microbaculum marinum]
ADGLPVKLKLSAGQAHDGRCAADMLDGIGRGQALLADAAYDSDALRQQMTAQGGWLCAKPVSYRRRKPPFSRWLYRFRNVVERFFCRLKHYRAIATRYEKHDENYLAIVKLASIRMWIKSYESTS